MKRAAHRLVKLAAQSFHPKYRSAALPGFAHELKTSSENTQVKLYLVVFFYSTQTNCISKDEREVPTGWCLEILLPTRSPFSIGFRGRVIRPPFRRDGDPAPPGQKFAEQPTLEPEDKRRLGLATPCEQDRSFPHFCLSNGPLPRTHARPYAASLRGALIPPYQRSLI